MQEKIADRKDAKIKKDVSHTPHTSPPLTSSCAAHPHSGTIQLLTCSPPRYPVPVCCGCQEAEAAAKAERLQLRQKLAARKAAERNKRLEKRQALRDIIRERRAKAKAKADAKRAVLRQAKERLKENAPRRPATAFLLWNNERTRGMTSEQHGKAKERAKAGGAMWQAMSDEEKAPWRARSVQVREEYQEALRRFRAEHVTPNTLPRPPLNGYVRYTTQRIPQLRAQRPGLHVSAYLTQAAADWREMGGEEKAEWNRVDEGEKAVFDRAKAEFLQKPKEDRMFGKMAKRVGRVVAKQTKGRGQLSEEKVGAGGGGVGV